MPRNTLSFSRNAANFILDDLDKEERESIGDALDYIKERPYEQKGLITSRFASPVVLYEYDDNEWRIIYTISYVESGLWIGVHSIDHSVDDW